MKPPICSAMWSDVNIFLRDMTVQYCCRSQRSPFDIDHINDNPYIEDMRSRSLQGEKTPHCQQCWDDYDNTGKSMRDIKNRWNSMADFDPSVKFVAIAFDNFCDLSCIYCNETSSSRIAKEKGTPQVIYSSRVDDYHKIVDWLDTIEYPFWLSYVGGELTYSPNFYTFMDIVLDRLSHKDITYSIITNGNTKGRRREAFYDLIDRIGASNHKLVMTISNESVGRQAEMIRYGLDWNVFEENVKYYAQSDHVESFIVCPTLTAFSIDGVHIYFEWLFDILRQHNKMVKIDGNWVQDSSANPTNASPSCMIYLDQLEQLISDNSDLVLNIENALLWVKIMKSTIGTSTGDLGAYLKDKAKQKQDLEIFDLYEYAHQAN